MTDMTPSSRPLQTEAPAGSKSSQITEWCKKLQGKPRSQKCKKIAAVDSFQNYYTTTMKAAENGAAGAWARPEARDLAGLAIHADRKAVDKVIKGLKLHP